MNKRGPKLMLYLLILSATMGTVYAQTSTRHEFTIQQAVDYARKNNVQVKNALLNVLIQKQTNREITAGALPNLSGNFAITDYIDIPTSLLPGEVFGQPAGTFIPVKFGTKYNSTAGLQLQQTLFDGQVFVGLQARQTSIDLQTKNVEVTEESIKTNIYKIYYQLVVSKTQIDILDANITRLQKLDHDTREIYKNGFAEKLDVDKVSVQITNLQTEKTKALNNISIGYLSLKTLMGMPVKDTLLLLDKISDEQIKADIMTDTSYDYNNRKEFEYLSLTRRLNEYNIKRYKLSYLPTLSLNGVYNKNAQRNTFDLFAQGGQWFTTSYIGINLNVPIFSGFAKDARVQRSKLELRQTENQLDNMKNTIDSEVEQARLNFRSAQTTMSFQKENMKLAETVYDQTKKKYEAGTGSTIEINAAQTDLITAQNNYINALYSAIIARVDYLKATGKL